MRQFNMIARGEKETLWHFVARCKHRIATLCTFTSGEPLRDEAAVLDVPFGAIEVRGASACFLAEDGVTVVATVPLPVIEAEKIQSFGGFGKARLRLVIDPMDRARVSEVMAGRTAEFMVEGPGFQCRADIRHFFSADQLEAIAWTMRASEEQQAQPHVPPVQIPQAMYVNRGDGPKLYAGADA